MDSRPYRYEPKTFRPLCTVNYQFIDELRCIDRSKSYLTAECFSFRGARHQERVHELHNLLLSNAFQHICSGFPSVELICTAADLCPVPSCLLAKILVFFGGKNCPSKSSEYEIDLTKSTAGVNVDSQMVIRRKENRLFKDIQDELGQNRESILKSALGRDVV